MPVPARSAQTLGVELKVKSYLQPGTVMAKLKDELTGLPNRRAVEKHLASLSSVPSATLLVDIDHFVFALAALGVEESDRILVTIARMIQAAAAPAFVARTGGDEFLVLAPHDEATLIATRLHQAIRANFAAERQRIRLQAEPAGVVPPPDRALLTLSIGIVHVTASAETFEQRLRAADHACMQAKLNGRDCTYEGALNQRIDA